MGRHLLAGPNDEGTKPMRHLIAGNWKMHGTEGKLAEIAAITAAAEATPSSADLLICPPATLIARAAMAACGRVAIGGRDCSAEVEGAFTGDISTGMLIDACRFRFQSDTEGHSTGFF